MLRSKDITKKKNNCFPNSAFVNVVSEDLINKLNELGYYDTWSGGIHSEELKTYTWITNCCWGLTGFKLEESKYIDCGDNVELFLAIASIRNDTDKGQWFVDDTTGIWERFNNDLPSRYMQMEGHKATVEELIEFYSK